jgi:hypothetical protein
MTISLLSKFKPAPYFLKLEPEWIEFSYDSQELGLLEKIALENEEKEIGINLLKRNGIHPSEDEAIKEIHQAYLDNAKAYYTLIADTSTRTGLTRTEVQLGVSEELNELEEELRSTISRAKDTGDLSKIREEVQKFRQSNREERERIATTLISYRDQIKQTYADYNKSFDEYYINLMALFLSGKRLEGASKATFTAENIRNLHSGFRGSLASFLTNEINGWERNEGKE